MEVLELVVAGARYAVPLPRVVEVLARVWLTPLPGVPKQVVGAFAYRGEVAVAVDIRPRLGQVPRAESLTDQFVVTRGRQCALAIVVDEVVGVQTLRDESVPPPPIPSAVFRGIIARSDGLLMLDDLDALLSPEEEAAAERAIQALSS